MYVELLFRISLQSEIMIRRRKPVSWLQGYTSFLWNTALLNVITYPVWQAWLCMPAGCFSVFSPSRLTVCSLWAIGWHGSPEDTLAGRFSTSEQSPWASGRSARFQWRKASTLEWKIFETLSVKQKWFTPESMIWLVVVDEMPECWGARVWPDKL